MEDDADVRDLKLGHVPPLEDDTGIGTNGSPRRLVAKAKGDFFAQHRLSGNLSRRLVRALRRTNTLLRYAFPADFIKRPTHFFERPTHFISCAHSASAQNMGFRIIWL